MGHLVAVGEEFAYGELDFEDVRVRDVVQVDV
jgi:hypothetical protein